MRQRVLKMVETVLYILLLILPYLCYVVVLNTNIDMDTEVGNTLFDSLAAIGISLFHMMRWGILLYLVISIFVIGSVIFQTRKKEKSSRILFWNMIIKICYIPFYLITFVGAVASLIMVGGFILLPIYIVIDCVFLVPTAVCGICGAIRLANEDHSKTGLAVFMAIGHLIFVLDVIAAIILFASAKSTERKK